MIVLDLFYILILTSFKDKIFNKCTIDNFSPEINTEDHDTLQIPLLSDTNHFILSNCSLVVDDNSCLSDEYILNSDLEESNLQRHNEVGNCMTLMLTESIGDVRKIHYHQTVPNTYNNLSQFDQTLALDKISSILYQDSIINSSDNVSKRDANIAYLSPSNIIKPLCSDHDKIHIQLQRNDLCPVNILSQLSQQRNRTTYNRGSNCSVLETTKEDAQLKDLNSSEIAPTKQNIFEEESNDQSPFQTNLSIPQVKSGKSVRIHKPPLDITSDQPSLVGTLKRKNKNALEEDCFSIEHDVKIIKIDEEYPTERVKTSHSEIEDDELRQFLVENYCEQFRKHETVYEREPLNRKIDKRFLVVLIERICKILSSFCAFKKLSIDVKSYFVNVQTFKEIKEAISKLQIFIKISSTILRPLPEDNRVYLYDLKNDSIKNSESIVHLRRKFLRDPSFISTDILIRELVFCLNNETSGEINSSLLFTFYNYPLQGCDLSNYRKCLLKIIILIRFAFVRSREDPSIKLSSILENNIIFYFCVYHKIKNIKRFLKRLHSWINKHEVDLSNDHVTPKFFLYLFFKDCLYRLWSGSYNQTQDNFFNAETEDIKEYIGCTQGIISIIQNFIFSELCYSFQDQDRCIFQVQPY